MSEHATASREHLRKPRKRYRFADRESAENAEQTQRHEKEIALRFLSRVVASIHRPTDVANGPRLCRLRTFKVKPPGTEYTYAVSVLSEDMSGYQYFAVTFICPGQAASSTVYDQDQVRDWIKSLSCGFLDDEQRALRDLLSEALSFRFAGIE